VQVVERFDDEVMVHKIGAVTVAGQ